MSTPLNTRRVLTFDEINSTPLRQDQDLPENSTQAAASSVARGAIENTPTTPVRSMPRLENLFITPPAAERPTSPPSIHRLENTPTTPVRPMPRLENFFTTPPAAARPTSPSFVQRLENTPTTPVRSMPLLENFFTTPPAAARPTSPPFVQRITHQSSEKPSWELRMQRRRDRQIQSAIRELRKGLLFEGITHRFPNSPPWKHHVERLYENLLQRRIDKLQTRQITPAQEQARNRYLRRLERPLRYRSQRNLTTVNRYERTVLGMDNICSIEGKQPNGSKRIFNAFSERQKRNFTLGGVPPEIAALPVSERQAAFAPIIEASWQRMVRRSGLPQELALLPPGPERERAVMRFIEKTKLEQQMVTQ